ncbi:conserved hypothetical protein [Trichinella spiralis]|uniref:hypothetical protein n=1 Tax=Trichinella spiralis TaxID=6334 RepID=UPI0001EFDE40|nr:conserved hypothetical protein [Trichinella spiralis]
MEHFKYPAIRAQIFLNSQTIYDGSHPRTSTYSELSASHQPRWQKLIYYWSANDTLKTAHQMFCCLFDSEPGYCTVWSSLGKISTSFSYWSLSGPPSHAHIQHLSLRFVRSRCSTVLYIVISVGSFGSIRTGFHRFLPSVITLERKALNSNARPTENEIDASMPFVDVDRRLLITHKWRTNAGD